MLSVCTLLIQDISQHQHSHTRPLLLYCVLQLLLLSRSVHSGAPLKSDDMVPLHIFPCAVLYFLPDVRASALLSPLWKLCRGSTNRWRRKTVSGLLVRSPQMMSQEMPEKWGRLRYSATDSRAEDSGGCLHTAGKLCLIVAQMVLLWHFVTSRGSSEIFFYFFFTQVVFPLPLGDFQRDINKPAGALSDGTLSFSSWMNQCNLAPQMERSLNPLDSSSVWKWGKGSEKWAAWFRW